MICPAYRDREVCDHIAQQFGRCSGHVTRAGLYAVWTHLAHRADQERRLCWPTIEGIARTLNYSPRWVQYAIADLRTLGLLWRRQRRNLAGAWIPTLTGVPTSRAAWLRCAIDTCERRMQRRARRRVHQHRTHEGARKDTPETKARTTPSDSERVATRTDQLAATSWALSRIAELRARAQAASG